MAKRKGVVGGEYPPTASANDTSAEIQKAIDYIQRAMSEGFKEGELTYAPAVLVFALMKLACAAGRALLELSEERGGEMMKADQMEKLEKLCKLFLAECRKGDDLTDEEVAEVAGKELVH